MSVRLLQKNLPTCDLCGIDVRADLYSQMVSSYLATCNLYVLCCNDRTKHLTNLIYPFDSRHQAAFCRYPSVPHLFGWMITNTLTVILY